MTNHQGIFILFFVSLFIWPVRAVSAWDGFDAASAGLVEIIPDILPARGDTVDVRSYDNDMTQTCLVESVTQNSRTVEVLVRSPDGQTRMLIMEGR